MRNKSSMNTVIISLSGLCIALFTGCTTTYSPDVQRALNQAGDNKGELIKVLEHYDREGDAQKRSATEFLIALI